MSLSQEQLLRDCEAVIDEDRITYAALALFGKRTALGKFLPQAEIVFEYRSSNASGPANQREEFRVGFFSCYNRLWELINLRNDKQHYQEGFFVSQKGLYYDKKYLADNCCHFVMILNLNCSVPFLPHSCFSSVPTAYLRILSRPGQWKHT